MKSDDELAARCAGLRCEIERLVSSDRELAACWLKSPASWPDHPMPQESWARDVLGAGAVDGVVQFLANNFNDHLRIKVIELAKNNEHGKTLIITGYLLHYRAFLLKKKMLKPRELALLAIATGIETPPQSALARDRRRDAWSERRDEAADWTSAFLHERRLNELYDKGLLTGAGASRPS